MNQRPGRHWKRPGIPLCVAILFAAFSPDACFQGADPLIGHLALVPYNFAPGHRALCNGLNAVASVVLVLVLFFL